MNSKPERRKEEGKNDRRAMRIPGWRKPDYANISTWTFLWLAERWFQSELDALIVLSHTRMPISFIHPFFNSLIAMKLMWSFTAFALCWTLEIQQ